MALDRQQVCTSAHLLGQIVWVTAIMDEFGEESVPAGEVDPGLARDLADGGQRLCRVVDSVPLLRALLRVQQPRTDPLAEQIDQFAAVIRGEQEPLVSGRDGLKTMMVVNAVLKAAATGWSVSAGSEDDG